MTELSRLLPVTHSLIETFVVCSSCSLLHGYMFLSLLFSLKLEQVLLQIRIQEAKDSWFVLCLSRKSLRGSKPHMVKTGFCYEKKYQSNCNVKLASRHIQCFP